MFVNLSQMSPFPRRTSPVGIRFSFYFVQVGILLWIVAIIAMTAAFGLGP